MVEIVVGMRSPVEWWSVVGEPVVGQWEVVVKELELLVSPSVLSGDPLRIRVDTHSPWRPVGGIADR